MDIVWTREIAWTSSWNLKKKAIPVSKKKEGETIFWVALLGIYLIVKFQEWNISKNSQSKVGQSWVIFWGWCLSPDLVTFLRMSCWNVGSMVSSWVISPSRKTQKNFSRMPTWIWPLAMMSLGRQGGLVVQTSSLGGFNDFFGHIYPETGGEHIFQLGWNHDLDYDTYLQRWVNGCMASYTHLQLD